MHLYKADEWQDATGKWHVADVQDLGHLSAAWWIPAHIFGLSQEQYIRMLVDKYHVTSLHYTVEKNVLIFSWDANHYTDAHRYKLDINRIARNKNFKF